MTISVILADDHHVVRQALRSLLEAEDGIQVVGEASDGAEALKLVEQLRPDVLVADLMMPVLNGLSVARRVHQRVPETRIVVLSMHADDAYVLKALENGALGYVLKDSDASDLVQAIRSAASGKRFLSAPLSDRAVDAYVMRAQSSTINRYDLLTPREHEVLEMTAHGFTSTEIGQKLHISPRTVEKHRSNLMGKLGLHRQPDLVRYAVEHRLVLPADVKGPPLDGADNLAND
jgi:DNA-binding NarL/FixJ family response regulator